MHAYFTEKNTSRENNSFTSQQDISPTTINLLTTAAWPLLTLMISIRVTTACAAIEELRVQVIKQVQNFENQAKLAGYNPRTILAARYCLCTALDEAVLSTSWGGSSIWVQQSLLATIHNETWGGERFYIILEKMAEDIPNNIELLELLYVILSLGFEGKHYNSTLKLDETRDNLFQTISTYKPYFSEPLSPHGKSTGLNPKASHILLPIWAVAIISCSILFIAVIIFQYFSNKNSEPVLKQIEQISLDYISHANKVVK